MTNEYGAELDRNGYAQSIFNTDFCFFCYKTTGKLDRHEIFHGANRAKSKRLGLWVSLCPNCHRRLHSADASMDAELKALGQAQTMRVYEWSTQEFIRIIGKNYL